jgi:hypothetical protein
MQLIKCLLLLVVVVGMAALSFADAIDGEPEDGRCLSGYPRAQCEHCCKTLDQVMNDYNMRNGACWCDEKVSQPRNIYPHH